MASSSKAVSSAGKRAPIADADRNADYSQPSAEEYAKILFNSANAIVVGLDHQGYVTVLNQAAETITGYSRSELRGKNWFEILVPKDRYSEVWKEFQCAGTLTLPKTFENPILTKKGEERQVVWQNGEIRNQERIVGFLCFGLDITDRRRMEHNLQDSEQKFRTLMDNIPDMIYFKDAESRFLQVSKAFATRHGFTDPEQLIGKTDFDIFSEDHARPAFEDEQRILRTGIPIIDLEEEETWSDRPSAWVSTTKMPLLDKAGNIVGTFGISRDITNRKLSEKKHAQMEVQLRQAQKLESVGQLAAGIAHEINTPTQFISDNARFLQDAFREVQAAIGLYERFFSTTQNGETDAKRIDELEKALADLDMPYLLSEIPKAVSQTIEGVERVSTIVKAMKEFSHPGPPEKTAVNLHQAIETTLIVCRNEWKYVADVVTDFDRTIPPIRCLIGDLNQIILNLVINAAQAVAGVVESTPGRKGKITVLTRRDGNWAEIQIKDTGAGIPDWVQPKVFDPFFTTKSVGKGTGQGLTIVYHSVVNKHNGTIRFETEAGVGTTFFVRLPIV